MQKNIKRSISLFMAVLIFLSCFITYIPFKAEAASKLGANITWRYSDGKLTISGSGDMYNFSSSGELPWFSYRESVTSIVVGNNVTSIGSYTFYNCKNATEVKIGESVRRIGACAFSSCKSLQSIELPESLTSIGDSAFSSCQMTEIKLPSNLAYLYDGAFYNCSKLTEITIPEKVTSIGEMAFDGCTSLKSLTIGKKVRTIGAYAFRGCEGLKEIVVPSNVTKIDKVAFATGSALESIIILNPDCNIYDGSGTISSNATIYGYKDSTAETYAENYGRKFVPFDASGTITKDVSWVVVDNTLMINGSGSNFSDCRPKEAPWYYLADEIENIKIENKDLKNIGQFAFWGLNNVKRVTIPSNITLIEKYAFHKEGKGIEVEFAGTSEQWKDIQIDYGNTALRGATVKFTEANVVEKEHISKPDEAMIAEEFILEHISSANDALFTHRFSGYGFYNNIELNKTTLNAYNFWEVLGDVGELVSFDINDLSFTANYFDIYLADMILALNDEESLSSFDCKITKTYDFCYETAMALLKSSKEWNESVTEKTEEEIIKALKGKTFELEDNTKLILEKVFNDVYTNNKKEFTNVFKGLSNVDGIIDKIHTGAEIANTFINSYNAYVISKAFYEVNDDFFTICYEVAELLSGTDYKAYGEEFKKSVRKAQSSELGSLQMIFEATYELCKGTIGIAYDKVLKEVLKLKAYPAVAKILGCKNAGSIAAVTFTYNTTYKIIDAVTDLGKESVLYKTLNYIMPVEKELQNVIVNCANELKSEESFEKASKFDAAFKILRQTNLYLYDKAYDYCSYNDGDDSMKFISYSKNVWNNMECHYKKYGSDYTMFSVHCPVDVYIYDEEGLLVTSVIDDTLVEYDSAITVTNKNGKKTFIYPADRNFKVEVIAREEGEMTYTAGKISDCDEVYKYTAYNIPLEENQKFTVEMPSADKATKNDYRLTTKGTTIDFDYSSDEACAEHSFGEWTEAEKSKKRYCNACGFCDFQLNCSHDFEKVMAYTVLPSSCAVVGHTVYICTGCSSVAFDGEDIYTDCKYEINNIIPPTCEDAGYTVYLCGICKKSFNADYVDAEGHKDTDTDGKCDMCSIALETPVNCSCICHNNNWIIKKVIYPILRMFYKLFKTNKYCVCNVSHY